MSLNRASLRKRASIIPTMVDNVNCVTRNAKGHPTCGHLTLKPLASSLKVNIFLENCTSLETTAETFSEMINSLNYPDECVKKDRTQMEKLCEKVYKKLYDYVNRAMEPSFDEIDSMLLVCSTLIENNMKYQLAEFILNCPKKFIITYSNNSERTPTVLAKLENLGLGNVRAYLITHIHESKLKTWNERCNTHIRGNALLQF